MPRFRKRGLQNKYKLRLKEARELRGYKTAVEFSEASGIGPAEICRYETGVTMPTVQVLCHMADTLKMRLDDLVEWPGRGKEA